MKSVAATLVMLSVGIASLAWAQGDVEKGKALVDAKCVLCHKEGGLAKAVPLLVGTNTDDYLKEAITNPKKAINPQVRMPDFKLPDDQIQAVIAYLKSAAKK